MEPQDENQKQTPNDTLKIAAFLAFFPLTGVFGIHDILIKKYWKCFLRIAIAFLIVISIFDAVRIINIYIPPDYPQIFFIIFVSSPFLIIASYAWAFAEGFQILKMRQEPKKQDASDKEHLSLSNKSKTQPLNASTDAHDTLYFKSNLSDGIKENQNQETLESKGEHAVIASFVISVVIFSFWGSTLFINSKEVGCQGGSIGMMLTVILIMPIYIILAIVAMILGVNKLKGRFRGLAIASIVMVIISVILVARFFIWFPTICSH